MDDWGEFIWTVVASSAGTTVLLGAAAWLFKGQISHWLNKDLESAKAQHQRDLEAYKITLIAAAERAKAGQEVRRASALKILDMKVDALKVLYDARRALGTELLSYAMMEAEFKTVARSVKMMDRIDTFREAMSGTELFFEPEDHQILLNFRGALLKAYENCRPGAAPPSLEAHRALANEVLDHDLDVDSLIRRQLAKLESLD